MRKCNKKNKNCGEKMNQKMNQKINVLIIGNGHYSTGTTVLEGKKSTDKDFGVVLPSMLELKRQGFINKIYLAARNGSKFKSLKNKLNILHERFEWSKDIRLFPQDDIVKDDAYIEALESLPHPGAVIIATPDHLHKEMILNSIKYKHHFLVVKPAVTKLLDLEDIVKKLENTNILGLVDYHKVYDDANLIIKEDYENNKYGKVQHVFTRITQRRDMLQIFSNWIGRENNVNHYLGSHYIHLVGFITGAIPIDVRATCQFGVAKEEHGIDTPDLVETQIRWKCKDGAKFTSYHIAGWSDPSETTAMTFQEIHIIGTKGQVDSDQRYRGFEDTIVNSGNKVINPYFFYLNKGLDGLSDLDSKYGFKSIKTFIKSAIKVENGVNANSFEGTLPTIRESKKVTAVIEAADRSMKENGKIINLDKVK